MGSTLASIAHYYYSLRNQTIAESEEDSRLLHHTVLVNRNDRVTKIVGITREERSIHAEKGVKVRNAKI